MGFCGVRKTEVKEGQKFGSLTVLFKCGKQRDGRCRCRCRCDCGAEMDVVTSYLVRKTRAGCRSCFGDRISGANSFAWKGCGNIPKRYWNQIKGGAIVRGLLFDVTLEDMWELFLRQGGKCNLSGRDLIMYKSGNKEYTASLDRIDSSKGYVLGNIQWVHKEVNVMKWDAVQDKFIAACVEIADRHHLKQHLAEERMAIWS